jgi:Cu/Ag efflux protein CusF
MIRVFTLSVLATAVGLSVACTQPASNQPPAETKQETPAAGPAAAPTGKAEHAFRGKVEQVDAAAKTLTVNGENVEGWMGPMTMVYTPDNPDVFSTIKPGDQITAKVFDGDFSTLHGVQIVPMK